MEHDMVMAGDGLRLRPLRRDRDDVAVVRLIGSDPVARQWHGSLRAIESENDAAVWVDQRLARAGTHEWMVEDLTSGEVLGRAGLHHGSAADDVEVGYWVLPRARGLGVARRAARLAARCGHEQLGHHRIGLVHAVANTASCRVALASSYRLEGTLRAALDQGDGVRHDAHVHARLADDPWDSLPMPVVRAVPVEVAGDGLVLRPWTQSGATTVWRVANDPAVASWNPFGLASMAAVRRWIDQATTWAGPVAWAVHDATTDQIVGGLLLADVDAVSSSAEVGYWVVPNARGRAVAARALAAAAGYAYDVLGLERLALLHAVENLPSCRVAAKAGFRLEGTTRRSYRYGDNELHDEHLHARLRTDSAEPC